MNLLYFAWVREKIGTGAEACNPPPSVNTIAQLLDWLETRGDNYKAAFAQRSALRVAMNGDAVGFETQIGTADEIAIFPPVTGGSR